MWPDDYLAAEPLIVQRAKDSLTGIDVLTAAEVAGVKESAQPPRALHVVYMGDDLVNEVSDEGAVQVVKQRWALVVAVRNARNTRSGEGVRREAGPLIAQVLSLFSGWRPPEQGFGPLRRVRGPAPAYTPGFGYFPLVFTTTVATGA